MGQKNNVLVDYLKDPDRFADVFNGVIGNGKMIIDPKYLEEADPKYDGPIAVSPETGDRAEEIERIRDIKKVYKGGKILQILCLEDQDYIDYSAPARTLEMDAMEYRNQLTRIRKQHKEAQDYDDKDERLCGMKKDDKLSPIITIWWYHGDKPYDGPRCLKDMLPEDDSPMGEFVSDYRINVLTTEPGDDSDRFHTEFGALYKVMTKRRSRDEMRHAFLEDETLQNIDDDTLRAIAIATDRPQLWEKRDKTMNETGGHSMCQAFDEIEEMAAEKAKIKERTDIINNMIGNGMSVDDISRVTNIPIEDVKTLVME